MLKAVLIYSTHSNLPSMSKALFFYICAESFTDQVKHTPTSFLYQKFFSTFVLKALLSSQTPPNLFLYQTFLFYVCAVSSTDVLLSQTNSNLFSVHIAFAYICIASSTNSQVKLTHSLCVSNSFCLWSNSSHIQACVSCTCFAQLLKI